MGKTGLKVSLLAIGGSHIGSRSVTEETSKSVIREAIDRGVNFLDNARDYHGGRSEELMGKALTEGYREKVYLSFSKQIIPILRERNIGIIGMKSVAYGSIVNKNIASIGECLSFTMSLPVSTLVSGIGNLDHLRQNVRNTKKFSPMNEEQFTALLERTYDAAQGGKNEWYKRTTI
jgi:predicted aldo/keto reductase-like oxidoreductase